MYTTMTGLEALGIDEIDGIDWFDEFSDVLVAQQNPDGSWPPCIWDDEEQILATEWALLTLQKAVSAHPPPTKWTYMVYLDADNNLEDAGINDFLEMAAVGSTADVNIVVQMDRIDGMDTSYDDWTDCKRYLVTYAMTPTIANALEDLGEVNMGDPNTLANFMVWGIQNYPADHYVVVLWDHGSGWKLAFEKQVKGVCFDDTDLELFRVFLKVTMVYKNALGMAFKQEIGFWVDTPSNKEWETVKRCLRTIRAAEVDFAGELKEFESLKNRGRDKEAKKVFDNVRAKLKKEVGKPSEIELAINTTSGTFSVNPIRKSEYEEILSEMKKMWGKLPTRK